MELDHNRHDEFFKAYFGQPQNLSALVQASFPTAVTGLLDFSTLKIEPGTYIDEELQAHFSDLAASVQGRYGPVKVYVVVEHKSFHDPLALVQILRYMVRVWSQEKKPPLTPILPLLFYHGQKKEVASEFQSLFDPTLTPDLMAYQPAFLTQIFNLAVMNPLELQASRDVVAAALAMKAIRRGVRFLVESLVAFLEKYGKDFIEDPNFDMIEVYLGSVEIQGEENWEQTLEELLRSEGMREGVMTLAEYFETRGLKKGYPEAVEKGRKEGRQEGRKEGRQEEKIEMARRMKSKGMSLSDIAEFTGLTEEEVRRL